MDGKGGSPPPTVLSAFGLSGAPVPLAGGQGESFRCGDAVLKRVELAEEAEWAADVFESLAGPGFRVPSPLRTPRGAAVCEGWAAWQWLDGEHAGPNGGRWPETLAACEAFHSALVGVPRPAFLDIRSDGWSVADRMAWGEAPLPEAGPFSAVIGALASRLEKVDLASQVIHGDFTANVLFAPGQPPAVIDFSPYWRPAAFAASVVVVDAVAWTAAGDDVFELVAGMAGIEQLLVRAALRRVLEAHEHVRRGRALRPGEVEAHAQCAARVLRQR